MVSGGLAGIAANSLSGNVKITTSDAAVSGQNYWGIWGSSSRDISISSGGDVTGTQGIVASGSSGAVDVKTAAGSIIKGTSGGGVIVNGGNINIENRSQIVAQTFGIYSYQFASGSEINIKTFDSITSETGDGISAISNSFGPRNSVSVEANGYVIGGMNGISVNSTVLSSAVSNVSVRTALGTLVQAKNADGINVRMGSFSGFPIGNVQISTGGAIVGARSGIVAENQDGEIDIDVQGNVTGTGGNGVYAFSSGGNVSVQTEEAAKVFAAGTYGIRAYTVSGPSSSVIANGAVEGGQYGIEAFAKKTTVVANNDVKGAYGAGIYAVGLSDGTSVTTAASHEVRGEYSDGIDAISIYSGDTFVNAQGDVFGSINGIYASANNGSTSVITGKGKIAAASYSGISAFASKRLDVQTSSKITAVNGAGITAFAVQNTLDLLADSDSSITSTNGSGIFAGSYYDADVNLVVDGNVTGGQHGIDSLAGTGDLVVHTGVKSTIKGLGGDGISLKNAGEGFTRIQLDGDTSGSDHGVKAVSEKAAVDILNGNGTIVGQGADGIYADAFTAAKITNSGFVMGLADGVKMLSKQGNTLVNSGAISNLSLAEADVAVLTDFSATSIENVAGGTIRGRVYTSAGGFNDTFANAGLWQTSGASDFGGGIDDVTNSGVIRFGAHAGIAEAASFGNLENLVNSGTVSGLDQVQGDGGTNFDTLNVAGNYVGGAGAMLALDVFVGDGSLADMMIVDGNTSGKTAIQIRNTNPVEAAPDANGITLVSVKGTASASDFFLAGGPLSAGLFNYDLAFEAAAGDNRFLLKSTPGTGVSETVVALGSVQKIWQGGIDAWNTHQGELRDDVQITAVADPALPETKGNKALWASIRGDWTQQKSQTSFTYLNAANNYSAGYNQNTYGVDGGVDFVTKLGDDATAMFGIVAGYQTSNLDFKASANGIELEGGSLGAYGSLSAHGVFADVLVKNDWLSLDYKVPGTGNAKTHGQSFGASGNLGYRFGGARGYIEPMLSLTTSRTTIDNFVLGGTTVSPEAATSTRAGAGARFGLSDANYAVSLTARVWNGLGGGNDVNVSGAGLSVGVSDAGFGDGVSGEVNGKLSVNLSEAALLFAGGSLQFSKDTASQSLNGGARFSW